MIKCCSKKNKIWTVPLECLKNQSKPIKFTSGRVNKGLFPLYMIEELRFRGILYAAKLMILMLIVSSYQFAESHSYEATAVKANS